MLALTPHLAAWCKTLMDGALGVAGTSAAALGFDKLANVGVLYPGLQMLGGGAILTGLVLGGDRRQSSSTRSSSMPRRSRSPARC